MREVGALAAFAAGILSFLSPCVLPLIPAYLSLVSGYAFADVKAGNGRFRTFLRTLAFVLGFTLVFVVLGLLFSGASLLFGGLTRLITRIAGVLVILLGLNLILDLFQALNLEARFHLEKAPRGFLGSFLLGTAFAAGWSPCVGPILASILLYAARNGDAARSLLLLSSYSLGLALPFLAASLFLDGLTPLLNWFKAHARAVKVASGALLILLGLAMVFGQLAAFNALPFRMADALSAALDSHPIAVRAISAAFWGLLALAAILPGALLRKRRPSWLRLGLSLALAALAISETAGLFSTARMLAAWLSFRGA
jgi:cytochrome c-type biogenesis protein